MYTDCAHIVLRHVLLNFNSFIDFSFEETLVTMTAIVQTSTECKDLALVAIDRAVDDTVLLSPWIMPQLLLFHILKYSPGAFMRKGLIEMKDKGRNSIPSRVYGKVITDQIRELMKDSCERAKFYAVYKMCVLGKDSFDMRVKLKNRTIQIRIRWESEVSMTVETKVTTKHIAH
jgi:hypothetical protein